MLTSVPTGFAPPAVRSAALLSIRSQHEANTGESGPLNKCAARWEPGHPEPDGEPRADRRKSSVFRSESQLKISDDDQSWSISQRTVCRCVVSVDQLMNWRDERLGLQVERALADVRLTQGCEVDVLIHDGIVDLGVQLANESEFVAVIEVLMFISGVREVTFCVAIADPVRAPKNKLNLWGNWFN